MNNLGATTIRGAIGSGGGGNNTGIENRLKILEDLIASSSYHTSLQQREKFYSHVFKNGHDLLHPSCSNDVRHKVWRIYTQILNGEAETIGQLRYYLFDLLLDYEARDEDIPYLIDFLMTLTDHGKILTHYESEIEYFLVKFIENIFEKAPNNGHNSPPPPPPSTTTTTTTTTTTMTKDSTTKVQQKFLMFLINLVKYNAACIGTGKDQKALIKMIRYVCGSAYKAETMAELDLIYEFLHVVLSYSHLPNETLSQFVVVLCVGVNREELYQKCQRIMKNLIGTYLGFACLTTLHHIIEDEINFKDKPLIRGAVHFLVQSLWGDIIGDERRPSISVNVILPAFKRLLENEMVTGTAVALEIAQGICKFLVSINETQSKQQQQQQQQQQQRRGSIKLAHISDTRMSEFSSETTLQTFEIVYQHTWDLVLDVCEILVANYLTNPPSSMVIGGGGGGGETELSTNRLTTKILSILKLLENILEQEFEIDSQKPLRTDQNMTNFDSNHLFSPLSLSSSKNDCSLLFLLEDNFIDKIFTIFELAKDNLPKETQCRLIQYRLDHIQKYRFDQEQILKKLKHLIQTYFIGNNNPTSIRLKCLEKLVHFLKESKTIDCDQFWEKVASGFFVPTALPSPASPELAMNFLIFLAKNSHSNKNLMEFIDIFEMTVYNRFKAYQRPNSLEMASHQQQHQQQPHMILHQISAPAMGQPDATTMFEDAIQSINGLIIIFYENISHITGHVAAVHSFRTLVKVLNFVQKLPDDHHHAHHHHHHHQAGSLSTYGRIISLIKRKLFHSILSLRTNRWAQLGVVDNPQPPTSASTIPSPSSYHYHHSMQAVEENVRFTPYILMKELPTYPPYSAAAASMGQNSSSNHTCHSSPPTSPQHQPGSGSVNLQQQQQRQQQQAGNSPTVFSGGGGGPNQTAATFHGAFIDGLRSVIDAVQHEKDWSVLQLIFTELSKTLKHKGLILAATSSCCSSAHSTPSSSMTHLTSASKTESMPDLIVQALCNFIDSIQSRFQELHFGEQKANKVDILAYIYDSISALVGYKLLTFSQTSIVKCLQNGLIHFSSKTNCVRQCIVLLTICSIEMQTTMNKYLQDIIIQLSKITTNKALAVPKLEFLSNIVLFPDIYYTFTNKQYLSIFMIAQSYINPYKYGEYTVALALRVISMWFLKCPIVCRMNLSHFLMKGFQNNILKEVEPNLMQLSQRLSNAADAANNSSSSRQCSKLENRFMLASSPPPPPSTPLTHSVFSFQSSDHHHQQQQQQQQTFALSSSSAFNQVIGQHHQQQQQQSQPQQQSQLGADSVILDPNDKENSKLELVEVCMDMLASNAFTTSSPLPLKPSMIDKLLNKDKTQYWMIGHKIIQITTTGCTSRAMRNGLCNKCYTICHMNKSTMMQSSANTNHGHQYYQPPPAPPPQQPHHSLTSLTHQQWNERSHYGSSGQFDFNNSTTSTIIANANNVVTTTAHMYSGNHCKNGPMVQNNNSSSSINNNNNQARRRHRSEINHSTRMKHPNAFTNDDYFMNRTNPMAGSIGSTESDLNAYNHTTTTTTTTPNSRYCRCWCQTWAEILIRRSTGTTRLILRVENNLGDFPQWTSSKDEDGSLAQIFKNSNPDLNLAWKLHQQQQQQKSSESLVNMVDEISSEAGSITESLPEERSSTTDNSGTISSLVMDCNHQPKYYPHKTSHPVTRAASFGSRMVGDLTTTPFSYHEMNRQNVVRKLEKEFSFEEIDASSSSFDANGSQTSLLSSINGVPIENLDQQPQPQQQQQQQQPFPVSVFRDRGHTISVMTPVQKTASSTSVGSNQNCHVGHGGGGGSGGGGMNSQSQDASISASNMSLSNASITTTGGNNNNNNNARHPISPVGLSPQFVFLQLYYNSMFREEIGFGTGASSPDKPIQLERNDSLKRSLNIFDCITPYETHKIGVVYVGPGQVNSRAEILANQIGSYRYAQFLKNIGQLISLEAVDPKVFYVGGLGPMDGPYAISWCDHLVQMIFHVATLMPTLDSDPSCNNKMAHIGNDLVCIVYNNCGEKVDLLSLKCGFGRVMQAMVMITPLEYESNIVEIQSKKEFAEFIGHTESQVLSDKALPIYVRQLALHANLGAMVYNPKQEMRSYHISNWLSRLRTIKRVRCRAQEQQQQQHQLQPQDSTGTGSIHSIRSSVSSGGGGGGGGPSSVSSQSTNSSGGTGGSQQQQQHRLSRQSQSFSSKIGGSSEDTDSALSTAGTVSSMAVSPNPNGVANGTVFDYETNNGSNQTVTQRLFPDFTEFTKD